MVEMVSEIQRKVARTHPPIAFCCRVARVLFHLLRHPVFVNMMGFITLLLGI